MELTAAVAIVRLPVDLHAASMVALTRDLQEAIASPAPVVVLAGANRETYCLGLAIGAAGADVPAHAFADLLTTLHHAPKPLLAAVDGRAIGGGLGLACACDWLVATDRATFALPELVWGLLPAIIWPVLTDRMAPHVVRQWTLSAYARSAAQGHAAGLVDAIVAPGELDRGIAAGARALRRLDAAAVQRLRRWAREARQRDLPAALQAGATITAEMLRQPSVQRRWQAFAEGESPWSA